MSLLKVPLLFADAIGMRITGKPPNEPLPLIEHVVPDWREKFLKSLAWPCVLLRAIYWSAGIMEMIVIIANHTPSLAVSQFITSTIVFNNRNHGIAITPLFLFGNFLTIVGTVIRLQCYRTLGRLFTFELSIRQDHRLVSEGPYAVVRHPSYTGMILTITGAICSQYSGSWLMECGLLDMWFGKVLVIYWLLVAGAVVTSLILRIAVEDRLLQRKFGNEWVEWNRKVPYGLIPWVY
ncbi:hypothetical protein IW261DRAFT_479093 [Armillaria novae-zelandiae]|uniref:Protein-S-isoprenylcysteine O-methyltransferase n=1 Tax=Armillaria novae-zelandiae TaxID=153914 RepID=A0AA39TA59_9AGAR|nr:hypothetical protein IW261DRAFT_479093 [Armillaria novae-zelandiae]